MLIALPRIRSYTRPIELLAARVEREVGYLGIYN